MNQSAHILYHMVKADFLERVRRYSFLMTLAGALSCLRDNCRKSCCSGGGRLSRPVQLGVDRHDDGDLLLDVSIAVRILRSQEFD